MLAFARIACGALLGVQLILVHGHDDPQTTVAFRLPDGKKMNIAVAGTAAAAAANKAVLKPVAREKLSKLSGILLTYPGEYKLGIEGHTDSVGSDGYNQKLSPGASRVGERRAGGAGHSSRTDSRGRRASSGMAAA